MDTKTDKTSGDATEQPSGGVVAAAEAETSGRVAIKPIWYFFTYCTMYFAGGCMLSATTLILPYLQELLNINESESSLIYTITYIGQVIGSLIAGQIVSQSKWKNTHLYPGFISACTAVILFLIPFINNYLTMCILWFVIGIWYGGNQPVLVVYVFRIYNLDGAIMYSRILLCFSTAQALFSVSYNIDYAQYTLYPVILVLIFNVISLVIILPTPSDGTLIQTLAEKVIQEAEIEVVEHYDEDGNIDLDITVRPQFIKPEIARRMASRALPGMNTIDEDNDNDNNDNNNRNNNSDDTARPATKRGKTLRALTQFFDLASTDAVVAMADPLRHYEDDLVTLAATQSTAFADAILDATLAQRALSRQQSPDAFLKTFDETKEIHATINVENIEQAAETALSRAFGLDIGVRSHLPSSFDQDLNDNTSNKSDSNKGKDPNDKNLKKPQWKSVRTGMNIPAEIDGTSGNLVLSHDGGFSAPTIGSHSNDKHYQEEKFGPRISKVLKFGSRLDLNPRHSISGSGNNSKGNNNGTIDENLATHINDANSKNGMHSTNLAKARKSIRIDEFRITTLTSTGSGPGYNNNDGRRASGKRFSGKRLSAGLALIPHLGKIEETPTDNNTNDTNINNDTNNNNNKNNENDNDGGNINIIISDGNETKNSNKKKKRDATPAEIMQMAMRSLSPSDEEESHSRDMDDDIPIPSEFKEMNDNREKEKQENQDNEENDENEKSYNEVKLKSDDRQGSSSMQYTDLMYSTNTLSMLPGLGINEIEKLDDELSDRTRKVYVYIVLFFFACLYFYEGFMLAFAPSYCINQLGLSDGTTVGAGLISAYYIGSLPGRVIAAFIFKYVQYATLSKIIQVTVVIAMISVIAIQWIWDYDNSDDSSMNEILLIGIYGLYGLLGFCRNVGFSAAFGLISPVHPVTALVGTGDAIARAGANAIAGYGIGTLLETFGFEFMPYIAFGSTIIQIILQAIILTIHGKAKKIEKEKEALVVKSMKNVLQSMPTGDSKNDIYD